MNLILQWLHDIGWPGSKESQEWVLKQSSKSGITAYLKSIRIENEHHLSLSFDFVYLLFQFLTTEYTILTEFEVDTNVFYYCVSLISLNFTKFHEFHQIS